MKNIKVAFNQLNQETKEQREDFYSSSVAYEQKRIDDMISAWENRGQESSHNKYRLESNYIHATKTNESIMTNTLIWLKDSEEYFNEKLMQASSKLEKFGFLEDNISMDIVSAKLDNNRGLSFEIKGFDSDNNCYAGRVAARLVWVDCYEKQSHYRWIVTLKDGIKK